MINKKKEAKLGWKSFLKEISGGKFCEKIEELVGGVL
jgi:hypothetical protein